MAGWNGGEYSQGVVNELLAFFDDAYPHHEEAAMGLDAWNDMMEEYWFDEHDDYDEED